jgi:hypothetical protein
MESFGVFFSAGIFLLPLYDICNIGEVEVFSIYMDFCIFVDIGAIFLFDKEN